MKKLLLISLLLVVSNLLFAQSYGNFRQVRLFSITSAGDTLASSANDGRIWYDFSTDQYRGIRNGSSFSFADAASTAGPSEVGEIISDNFNRADGPIGANWTTQGGTFAIASNKLSVTNGGALSTGIWAKYTAYGNSNAESATIESDITVGTINGTSFGIGFGFQIFAAGSGGYMVGIGLDNTGSDLGKITVYKNNTTAALSVSANGMTISAGDVLHVTVKIINHRIVTTVTNTSVSPNVTNSLDFDGSMSYQATNDMAISTFTYAIYGLGGTHLVDNFVVKINDFTAADYLLIGDSMTRGKFGNKFSDIWGGQLKLLSGKLIVANACGGNRIESVNVDEIELLNPKNIILFIGYNNVDGDANAATTLARYATLATSLDALSTTNAPSGYSVANGNLYFMSIPPSTVPTNSALIPTINAGLYSTYGTGYIDIYGSLSNGAAARYSSDGVHPDPQGHAIIANVVYNDLNLIQNEYPENTYNVRYGNNGYTTFPRFVPTDAFSPVHVVSSVNPSVQVSTPNAVDGGGYLTSAGVANTLLTSGYQWEQGNLVYRAKNASVSGIFMASSTMNFYSNTGLVVGNTFTPTIRMALTSTGLALQAGVNLNVTAKQYIGHVSTTPTALLHLNAGTASASTAPLKFTSGTVMTASEAGAMEYDGTNFFLSNGTDRGKVITENSDTWNLGISTTSGSTRTIAAIGTSSNIDLVFQNKGGNRVFSFNTTTGDAIITPGGSASGLSIRGGASSTVTIGSDGTTTTGLSITGSATTPSLNGPINGLNLGVIGGNGDAGTNTAGDIIITSGNGYATSGDGGGGDINITVGQRRTAGSGIDGSIILETRDATGTLKINGGANEQCGTSVLVGGTVTVNNTKVTANSIIILTSQVDGGTPGFVRISARSVGTSFTITSSSGTDTSTIGWLIIEPN